MNVNKEKQVEEIAKVIDDRLIEAGNYLGSMNKGEGYWIAQKLVEHYQQIRETELKQFAEKFEKRCIDKGIFPAFVKRQLDETLKEFLG